ncbi:ACS family hexuronate transporter-like MFS transporter [Sphingomonas endophytica]|uniref:ACS family hexuronate transporter-like MFS transporter n=1 Tax=Sphingomonas endophytica TaxID=869719 RepID=A0A7X0JF90_9SPHN|nr:MFS transporter [Sphingomonas endophytica]MBB6505657.1 ACS family hexuronate transporter-like MFS transporter [Sphingomonas endophytica]
MASSAPAARGGWGIAFVVAVAIAISYLDRQTLPWAIASIQRDIPIGNQTKALLDSAFLATYGLMYLGGGWLLDRVGTRRGFVAIMAFWSLACASHGLAGGVAALIVSRLLLGMGEGGGFPAATRAVAERFAPERRATALGIINAGTSVGAVLAPPLIALLLTHADWLGLASWRWVFFVTGAFGLAWALWWAVIYRDPPSAQATAVGASAGPGVRALLARRAVLGVVGAKFLSDGAWYFYLFWLPKYLFEAHAFDLKQAATIGWIPYAAAGVGSVAAGGLSSRLLARGMSVNAARKIALGACAACMPWVMFVPHAPSIGWVIALFSLAFFGQQGWSTLVMTLPTDLIPRAALGRLAGLVGMGGAFGGIVMGQAAGWALDHGLGYAPVLATAASLHLLAFALICLAVPRIARLDFHSGSRGVLS